MARDNPLHDHPRSKRSDDQREAKRGDVKDLNEDGEEWESYGEAGTRNGGNPNKDEDDEGDLDVKGWRKLRDDPDERLTVRDNKNPNDAKGWRREYWRKKPKPMS